MHTAMARFVVLAVVLHGLLAGAGPAPARQQRTELTYRVLSAERCPDVQGMAISSSNSSLRMVGRTKVVFDIDFMVERPASTLTKLAVNETRCRERVSEATCTPGRNFAIKSGVCAVLGMKMMPWTELVDNMQPPLRCPMKKGLFSGRGIGIDMQVAKMTIRPDEDVGTVVVGRGTVFDQDHAPYLCFQVTVDLVRVRVRT